MQLSRHSLSVYNIHLVALPPSIPLSLSFLIVFITKISIYYRYSTVHSNKMIKSTSTIRTLAIAMLLLVFHLASNRTPHNVTGFSFDHHVASYSRAVVDVPSTHHHVVGIHRPVPLQLRDQQQQQQQHRSILLADSILFQTLSDSTKQHNDLRTTTPIMTMSEKALTPQWKSNDELL